MKKIWITYSPNDNKSGNIESIAQELEKSDIFVKLDRWNIQRGKKLWEQIEKNIADKSKCDAWAFIVTQNSVGTESSKKDVANTLERISNTRGQTFPIILIFLLSVDKELFPSIIGRELYVSTKDNDWITRIKSGMEDKKLTLPKPVLRSYSVQVRRTAKKKK